MIRQCVGKNVKNCAVRGFLVCDAVVVKTLGLVVEIRKASLLFDKCDQFFQLVVCGRQFGMKLVQRSPDIFPVSVEVKTLLSKGENIPARL